MTDKRPEKKRAVLRRGMAEPDWSKSEGQPAPAKRQPFRWGIPRELRPGAPASTETPAERTARWSQRVRAGVIAIVVLACGLYVLHGSVDWFEADGVSMEPSLHNGDRIFVNRLAYSQIDFGLLDWAPLIDVHGRWATPGRGDVVIFKSPVEDKELVKRVIGLPGELVTIENEIVYVNGNTLDEPYAQGATDCGEVVCNWIVPDGQYFVLGDNRENSLDSRDGWFVPLSNIDGKKLFAY